MTSLSGTPLGQHAPEIWRAWHSPCNIGREYLFWSDSIIVADGIRDPFEVGPVRIYPNHVQMAAVGEWAPRATLRLDSYMAAEPHPGISEELDHAKWWLGLSIDEEVAVLVSLLCGIRLRSAGAVRIFETDGEPAGVPWYMNYNPPVQLPPLWHSSIIPSHDGAANLSNMCGLLSSFAALPPASAITLIKAARHYSNALMIANSDPEQAWLQLVTAVEVAAVQYQAGRFTDVQMLADAHAGLVSDLRKSGNEELIPVVANRLSRSMLATRRFVEFLHDFRPGPPIKRPQNDSSRVDWGQIEIAIKDIYKYRSRLLHEGIPFPGPLLTRPAQSTDDGMLEERPQAGVIYSFGRAGWKGEGLPMYLHVFAYIVRKSLLAWWGSLCPQPESSEPG
ncbi:hypothetical protein [Streptomyces sp. NPDC004042]|uniref:hypothetical protein n=1 Tax=Streptomyces sp. NPDC004042 TaxID=3154451 RepID=UPI0033BAFA93